MSIMPNISRASVNPFSRPNNSLSASPSIAHFGVRGKKLSGSPAYSNAYQSFLASPSAKKNAANKNRPIDVSQKPEAQSQFKRRLSLYPREVIMDIDFSVLENLTIVNSKLRKKNDFLDYFRLSRRNHLINLTDLSSNTEDTMRRNFAEIIGYFVIQLQMINYFTDIFAPAEHQELWNDMLTQLEKNISDYAHQNEYTLLGSLKKEIIYFFFVTKSLGFMKHDSLVHTMLKLHDTYFEGLLMNFERKVLDELGCEQFNEIKLNDLSEYEKYVDEYQIALDKRVVEYPTYLPYTMMIVHLNDLIKETMKSDFEYLQYLITEEMELPIFYNAVDRIIMRCQDAIGIYLATKVQLTILQNAVMTSNIEYLQRSFKFHRREMHKLCKSNSVYEYNFASNISFNQLKERCESLIYDELKKKIDEFLSIIEGFNWAPKEPRNLHNEYVDELILWLKSTVSSLETINKDLASKCYITSLAHISYRIVNRLAFVKEIAQINLYGLFNLKLDLKCLEAFMDDLRAKYQSGFSKCLEEIQQFLKLFFSGDIKQILDEQTQRGKFSALDLKELILIFEKFKEISSKDTSLPKLKKSDVHSVAKKLKEKLSTKYSSSRLG